jgi:hypothetical protein
MFTRRRQIKQAVLAALASPDIAEVRRQLAAFDGRDVVNPLFSALLAPNQIVRWHGVAAFGWVVPSIADAELETARVIMRRFLWSLNDESGGIGWGAPEAMAEIMANDDRLLSEYLHMLISYIREDGPELFQDGNFLELPMLQRGVLWGLGRLSAARREVMREAGIGKDLCSYLCSEDGEVRGLAIWALTWLGDGSACAEVAGMLTDQAEVYIYHADQLECQSVSALAKQYLHRCCT